MSTWRKCKACRRVLALSEFDDVEGQPAEPRCTECVASGREFSVSLSKPRSSADSVRAYRERTGNAYGKAYAKAKRIALQALADAHPEEYAAFLEKARIDVGLGPTRTS